MILGNGIDIIEISRVQKVFEKNSSKLVEKLLSKEEIEEFNLLTDDKNRVFFLAKHFSIKEAIAKAIGCGINNEFLSLLFNDYKEYMIIFFIIIFCKNKRTSFILLSYYFYFYV